MMHLSRIIKNSLHTSQIVPFAKLHHTKNGKQKSSIQQKRGDTSSNPPAILTSQKKIQTGSNRSFSYHSNSIFFRDFPSFPNGKGLTFPAFPPRRIPARRARDWIPGGRAAASCGNPSPTFAVGLGSTSTQGKNGKSWDRFLARQINQSWHYVTCCNL